MATMQVRSLDQLGSEDPQRLSENYTWIVTFSDPHGHHFQLVSRIPS